MPRYISGLWGAAPNARRVSGESRFQLDKRRSALTNGMHASPTYVADPREGTVAGPGGTVRLEPKVMSVLEVLSSRGGQVVSRDELIEQVWPGVIVTEHTLTRCIYQLRRDLGKIGVGQDVRQYNPIETLPKRGYRLLPTVDFRSAYATPVVPSYTPATPSIPFVVGQWVRGERFYGRAAQIGEILDGPRNCIWLLGTRRIGKTSLLKQMEFIASAEDGRRYFPVFWDFQGVDTPDELHLNFNDALVDAEERLARIGIGIGDIEADDLFVSLQKLRRRLRTSNLRLLLLCDEVEELIQLRQEAPSLLRKLRHAMQSRDGIRTVLASTIRLWALADQKEDTSPFLHGFTPPLYVERLTDDEARSLIEQAHLDPDERPRFGDREARAIREQCDNHPYLLQLVCKRYIETGDLDEAIEHVGTDRMVSYFFSVDFEMLSAAEQGILRQLARDEGTSDAALGEESSLGTDALQDTLRRLQNLAFIRRNSNGQLVLANDFFRRWLRGMRDAAAEPPVQATVSTAVPAQGEATQETTLAPKSLLGELSQRNVFRVGFAYVVVAWVLLQLGDIVFDFLEVPGWAGKLLIAFLALGLPVALILAWAFELTPEGLKWERDLDRSAGSHRSGGRTATIIVISILVAVAVLLGLYRWL